MIHRVVFGSVERFLGILIEHFAGKFPVWLAPVQVRVLPVSDRFSEYAKSVAAKLQAEGLRAEADERSEKVGWKIRQAQVEKIPYMLIVGEKEEAEGTVSVRSREAGDLGARSLEEFLKDVQEEIRTKAVK